MFPFANVDERSALAGSDLRWHDESTASRVAKPVDPIGAWLTARCNAPKRTHR